MVVGWVATAIGSIIWLDTSLEGRPLCFILNNGMKGCSNQTQTHAPIQS
jgi:hypothetical protein